MESRIVRLIVFSLAWGAILCVGVMFVGGLRIMFDMWRGATCDSTRWQHA